MIPSDIPPAVEHSPILRRVPFDAIPAAEWDRLYARTTAATPFSSWTFQRSWWDAYAPSAREHYLVLTDVRGTGPAPTRQPEYAGDDIGAISAIVPLMWRPAPANGGRPAGDERGTLYFGASYHADYATVLTPPAELPRVADLLAAHLVGLMASGWVDRIDLRRIAESDPLLDHLPAALDGHARDTGLVMRLEQEDVCPVIELEEDWTAQLARLDKKSRHELRRKLRRAEREGPIELRFLPLDASAAERFIHLHQARWGAAGLFCDDEDGHRSRVFLRRLAELEGAAGAGASFHIGEVSVAGEPIYVLAGFASRGTCYFYNAGLDPAYLDLSPGIVGTAAYLRDRIERGDARFDFLRGDEPYKYQWSARDARLMRLVVTDATEGPGEGAG